MEARFKPEILNKKIYNLRFSPCFAKETAHITKLGKRIQNQTGLSISSGQQLWYVEITRDIISRGISYIVEGDAMLDKDKRGAATMLHIGDIVVRTDNCGYYRTTAKEFKKTFKVN